ncbi:MAG: serine/threonine protein kinase, partial [Gammaproteobacteria bacterium]
MKTDIRKMPARWLLIFMLALLTGAVQASDKPLLMEGKKTLYQRVLSVPEAHLYEQPEDSATSSRIIPFSVLYVYERDNDWLKVGYDSFGRIAGWVKRDKAIAWNQALTV